MDGILLVDKPSGPTSFDCVKVVRRACGLRRVGHAGTLDPLASGLMVVCLGQGTKLVNHLMDGEKQYRGILKFGAQTDTDDALGEIICEAPIPSLSREHVDSVLAKFIGLIQQKPPIYSALKRGGEALYKKARRGEVITLEPREVSITSIQLVSCGCDTIEIDVCCGKGTYIRSLARDIGLAMGSAAHLVALRRMTASGFHVRDGLAFELVRSAWQNPHLIFERLIPLSRALPGCTTFEIGPATAEQVRHGQAVPLADVTRSTGSPHSHSSVVMLVGENAELCALARVRADHLLPIRVFL